MSQRMQIVHLLSELAPELLDRVEPRSRGGQADGMQSRQAQQGLFDLLAVVNWPVIPNDKMLWASGYVRSIWRRKRLCDFPRDARIVQETELTRHRIQRTEHPIALRATPLALSQRSRGRGTPVGTRLRPTCVAHLIHKHDQGLLPVLCRFPQGCKQSLFFDPIGGIGAEVLRSSLAQADPTASQEQTDSGEAVAMQEGEVLPNAPQGPAARWDR